MFNHHQKKRQRSSAWGQTALGWVDSNPTGAEVLATARMLLGIEQSARQVLPPAIASHCQVAKLESNAVLLAVPSAAYAARLRQLAPRIVERLNKDGWNLNEINVKIQANLPTKQTILQRPKESVPLDGHALEAFEGLRNNLPSGPLADAVARLVERHKQE